MSVDFLDSNVFIYPFSSAGARQRAIADRLVRDAIETARGCISHQVVQGCLNVLGSKAARPSPAPSRAGASASTPRICSMASASKR
jgi:predicted nucleic acid-binding protein